MTYDLSDLTSSSKPAKTHIQTANGGVMDVEKGGTIEISSTLKLSNCLSVTSLSHKLLSISGVTKELNCTVLMHPTFCILQDIRTGVIIGRGTERQGLYYVDEVTQGGSHDTHENITNNHEIELEQTVQMEQEEPIQEQNGQESIQEEETVERYVLPPRVNRGIPAKWYSPEKQSKSSRYPMANIVKGNLSKEAKAFNSSLYTEQIPNTVEQALESKNWKDAMDTEMKELMKNNT
ncbi:uncharacterized protein LOC143636488 [Bidens hawaiensis]|uniref:uncharacterized protein LOC143636488 n=1 Tax=Bidens hawaiensis TaxID=980011 RepID=UPI004049B4AE